MRMTSLWSLDGDRLELRPELERCGDPELKSRILGFLSGGGLVLRAPALRDDRLDPSRRDVVPLGYASDGEWIWPLEMAYYLERHDILPEADFVAHMRDHRFTAAKPADEALAAAARQLTEE